MSPKSLLGVTIKNTQTEQFENLVSRDSRDLYSYKKARSNFKLSGNQ